MNSLATRLIQFIRDIKVSNEGRENLMPFWHGLPRGAIGKDQCRRDRRGIRWGGTRRPQVSLRAVTTHAGEQSQWGKDEPSWSCSPWTSFSSTVGLTLLRLSPWSRTVPALLLPEVVPSAYRAKKVVSCSVRAMIAMLNVPVPTNS